MNTDLIETMSSDYNNPKLNSFLGFLSLYFYMDDQIIIESKIKIKYLNCTQLIILHLNDFVK